MVHTSYLVEHSIWGQNPKGYHVVNVLLHTFVALLLWQVLYVLKVPWPFAAALIFALHPVQVESVAWVTERKNVLSGVFYMSSLLMFLRWHATRYIGPSQGSSNTLYVISIVLFICALWSKTVTATLPFVIILLLWWKQALNINVVVRLLPFIILGVVMGSITAWIEQGHAGAVGEPWDLTLIERGLIAGRAIWFYIYKLFLPFNLTFIYPRWEIDSSDIFQYAYPLAMFLLITQFWGARKRIGRGPLTALLIFCGTLFPALGFLNVFPMQFSFVADHFQYLASAAMISLIVAILHTASKTLNRPLLVVGLAAICSLYLFNTWQLQAQYKDQTSLWQATIKKNPEAWIAHGNLGAIYMTQQRTSEAMESLTTAAELNPKHIIPFNNLAKLHLDLAQRQTRPEQAKINIEKALNYGTHAAKLGRQERAYLKEKLIKPRVAQDHVDSLKIVGDIKRYQKDDKTARMHYQSMLSLNPVSFDALNRLGAMELKRGEYLAAQKFLNKSVMVRPDQFDALYNLGVVYFKSGRSKQAEKFLIRALAAGSEENFLLPHYYLGLIAQYGGNEAQAKRHFEIIAVAAPEHSLGRKALLKMLDIELN